MTPPAATAAARRATARATVPARRRSTVAPRIPRRVSGPARGLRALPAPRRSRTTAPQPLGVRLVAFVATLPDRRLVESLVRGRGWIAVLATLLIGIVAMQVSLLKLNAGIGTAVERTAALERSNGELRAEVSRLGSGARIQEKAAALGMVMPAAGGIQYLGSRPGRDAAAAARALSDGSFATPAAAQPADATTSGGATGTTADPTAGSGSPTSTDGTSGASSTDGSSTTSTTPDTSTGTATTSQSTDTSGGSTAIATTGSQGQ